MNHIGNKANKIALMISINYTGTKYELKGCHNDVDNYKEVLIQNFGYNEKNIIILKGVYINTNLVDINILI